MNDLQGYDYSQAGAYCVTFCTQNRKCQFGEIVNGEVRLMMRGGLLLMNGSTPPAAGTKQNWMNGW